MLIIARREQETITIDTPAGDTITITVAEIRGRKQVAVGVEAPEHYSISRGANTESLPFICTGCGKRASGELMNGVCDSCGDSLGIEGGEL